MPIDPGPCRWGLPDPSEAPDGHELVAVGADLAPSTLLAGYRTGLFAMPDGDLLGWWSPDPRGILRPGHLHVSRSLRRALPRFEVTVDAAFAAVVAACADPDRPHGWISRDYERAYSGLHSLGWAHSVEVWAEDGSLAGGLFGVEVGGLFAAESKFHVRTDASKVALVALAALLAADGGSHRLIDVQWRTDHLATLGVEEVSRAEYLRALPDTLARPPVLGAQVPLGGLVGPLGGLAEPASRIRWRRA